MREITFYDFNLDLPVEKRWGPIIDAYDDYLPRLRDQLILILGQFGFATNIIKPIYQLTSEDNIMYYDEICYIAGRIGLDPYEVLLMQLIYETSSACTAAVLKVGSKDFFFRTMDWPMMFLKDITIGLNIRKAGQLIGKVTTWLGYLGFLTATNTIDNYTLTINYRRTKEISIGTLVKNLYSAVSMKWPIGYLVRYVIENSINKTDALDSLTKAELISPCYITMYVPNGETSIITRDCDKTVDIRTSELVQTNCDWNRTEPNILWSIERVSAIKNVQDVLDRSQNPSSKKILKLLLKHPVLNEETIYVHFQYGNEYRTLV